MGWGDMSKWKMFQYLELQTEWIKGGKRAQMIRHCKPIFEQMHVRNNNVNNKLPNPNSNFSSMKTKYLSCDSFMDFQRQSSFTQGPGSHVWNVTDTEAESKLSYPLTSADLAGEPNELAGYASFGLGLERFCLVIHDNLAQVAI